MGMSEWILGKVLPDRGVEFRELVQAVGGVEWRYALAEVNDFLGGLRPGELEEAVGEDPGVRLDPLRANIVAAMVEHAAGRLGKRAPSWVKDVEPLAEPWFASQLVALRLHLLTVSPPAFRRRNLFVDSSVGERV